MWKIWRDCREGGRNEGDVVPLLCKLLLKRKVYEKSQRKAWTVVLRWCCGAGVVRSLLEVLIKADYHSIGEKQYKIYLEIPKVSGG